MQVPATIDILQGRKKLKVPEIRVWCHPHKRPDFKEEDDGNDYYESFPTFEAALAFIIEHPEAETVPLVAFQGYELNLWAMEGKT